MTLVRLLAIVGAVSILVGLGLTSFSVILNPRSVGDMHGAGFSPSDFAIETHLFGLIVMTIGAILLIVVAVIRESQH
jgi:hypothetical protein